MSLKDRLHTTIKQNEIKEEKEQVEYYQNSSIAAQIDSLGVIDTFLADDDINSIYVNGAKNIYIERKGKTHKSTSSFRDNVQLENLIKKYAQNIGYKINEENPYIKFNHKLGINVSATLPPLSSNAVMFVKCYKDKHASFQALQDGQSISKEIALVLEAISALRTNIIIAGERSTLKTTILSTLLKNLPSNDRGVVVDYKAEIKNDSPNFSNFDFSNIKDKKEELDILNSIFISNPDRIYINDCDEKTLSFIDEKIISGLKGVVLTIEAKTPKEAFEKIALGILKNNPKLDYNIARLLAYKSAELVIFVKKDELNNRIISSISQINIDLNDNYSIRDIFRYNQSEHKSCGFIPDFFEEAKLNSLSINSNIFDKDYKHTYQKITKNETLYEQTKKVNLEILKKFKKDFNVQESEPKKELSAEEMMIRAQEKFEELKQNIQNNEENEESIEDIALQLEQNNISQEDENI